MRIKFELKVPIKRRKVLFKLALRKKFVVPKALKSIPIVNRGRDPLYQHLLQQEFDLWLAIPENFNQEDWEYIVNRRGFRIDEQNCLLLALYAHGFNIKDIHLVDIEQYRQKLYEKELRMGEFVTEEICGVTEEI